MTVDTSRPAVEALIDTVRNKYGAFDHFHRELADAAAALLDERDRLAANRDAWVSDAMTSTTELEQRIRDLEATVDNLRLISNANGDWNIKYQEVNYRAERAVAKLDAVKAIVRGSYVISGECRDKLRAILVDTETREEGDL